MVLHDESREEEVPYLVNSQNERIHLRDLNGRQLKWQNDNRPDAISFYIRYLFTRVFCRKVQAIGWENNMNKTPSGKAWAEIGPLRRRMLSAI